MTGELKPIVKRFPKTQEEERKESFIKEKKEEEDINITTTSILRSNIRVGGVLISLAENPMDIETPLLKPITNPVDVIMSLWTSEGFRKPYKGRSEEKAIAQIRKALDGSLFKGWRDCERKYTLSEIKKSITNMGLAAFDRRYAPRGKFKDQLASTPLPRFFRNKSALTTMTQSLFLFFLNNEPKPLEEYLAEMEDRHPEATKVLTDWFAKVFRNNKGKFSTKENLCFKRAVVKALNFYETRKDRLNISYEMMFHQHKVDLTMIHLLIRQVEDNVRGNPDLVQKYQPHWLLSEYLWDTYFPQFLRENKMLR